MSNIVKGMFGMLLIVTLLFSLAACGSSGSRENSAADSAAKADSSTSSEKTLTSGSESTSAKGNTALIVYFSHSGNTKQMAEMIAETTGYETFEIKTTTVYPDDYRDLIDQAKDEQNNNARPALVEDKDISGYDTVFIGYPNWWADMPMVVYTFLEAHDWNGKTVIPFCTHGGSGLSDTENTLREVCSGATVLDGLAIRDTRIKNSDSGVKNDVNEWLKDIGITD